MACLGENGNCVHGHDTRHAKILKPWEAIASLIGALRDRGVILIDRHDNPFCGYCSEVVLRRQ